MKIELRTEPKAQKAPTKPKTVLTRVLSTEGGKAKVRVIDANSPNFGQEFLYVFAQNVRAARKENKERLGAAQGVKQPA